jgi:molybdopterin synthase catalytic subunit
MVNYNDYIKTDLGFWKDEENNGEQKYHNSKI